MTFLSGWISKFGIPLVIVTDWGVLFESALWLNLINLLGTKHISTTAYHPCANGLVKCFHQQMKAALKAMPDPNQWVKCLPPTLLGIYINVKQDIDCTWAELFTGQLCLPGELFQYSDQQQLDPILYVNKLRSILQQLLPPAVRTHQHKLSYVSSAPNILPSQVTSTPSPHIVTCSGTHVRLTKWLVNISSVHWESVLWWSRDEEF